MGTALQFNLGPEFLSRVGVLVLGGGRGTRLYPLTAVRAKPAVPLCGRYRLVDIPLSNCVHSGLNRIFVLTQFNSHSLNRHIINTYRFDNFSGGNVEVLSAEQTDQARDDWFQGTADAIRKQMKHLVEKNFQHYLILSGDQLYRMDYRTLLATHLRKNADITVSALPVARKDVAGFGIMQLRADSRIKAFVEKPKEPKVIDSLLTPDRLFEEFGLEAAQKPFLASMGVYVFRAEVLERLLREHVEWIDFGREVIPHSLQSHRVYAHLFGGFWEDIGTVRSFFDVSMAMTMPNPPFALDDPSYEVYTRLRALPGVRVENAKIKNSILCEGTSVAGASIENSILGIRSRVGAASVLKRAIVLGAEYFESGPGNAIPMGIGPGCRISEAIIDQNARIGRGVTIRGSRRLKDSDGCGYAIRDGIVIVLKNAVIADGTTIG